MTASTNQQKADYRTEVRDAVLGALIETDLLDQLSYAVVDRLANAVADRLMASDGRAHWKRWADADLERVRALYSNGVDVRQIAKELGRTVGSINGQLSRMKLTRSSMGDAD